ncbi:MAG: hypothetical protein NZ849_08735 [Meiothermus sp.]|uniref:hypothetical protein n=1 Tax=Meiothermus sp. TaxID=1955249 RepID=UPI0025E31376|nr:hypothetical protein [Meiothermus sp.]MCS7059001.1 hypothetical protein [Meiothermus sp.]MCS7194978.1 hypothetical protein [Meiothermus sp.]MDW8091109.1 hypothetical protein [Meiothermus sp.]MDW8482619.1 hypothetical protein [Meiothermus sp.]
MKSNPSLREFWLALIGFLFGLWTYSLWSQGGWAAVLQEGWPGLLLALLAVAGVLYAYRKR